MDEIPSVIPKSILEVISRLENDGDNHYTWKLTQNRHGANNFGK